MERAIFGYCGFNMSWVSKSNELVRARNAQSKGPCYIARFERELDKLYYRKQGVESVAWAEVPRCFEGESSELRVDVIAKL